MAKSMTKNAIFNVAYKALSVIFPLVTVSYASRIFGAKGIGEVSSAQNLVTYFTMFASLGIPSYGVRIIAQSKNNKDKCNKIFTELFLINLISTLICLLVYLILVGIMDNSYPKGNLHIIFISLIALNIFNIEWVYQAFEEYRYIAIRSFCIKGISLVLLLVFVKNEVDLLIYACIVCFGTVGNYILNMFRLNNYVRFNFKNLSIIRHLKIIITFFSAILAIELYSLLDVTMLTHMTDAKYVGYYSNATKLTKTLANTMTAIGAVLLPRLSLYFVEKNTECINNIVAKFLNIIVLLSVPCCVGFIMIADTIVNIMFGVEFSPTILTIQILSPLIIMMPLSGGVFGQILLTSEREKTYLISVCLGAVANIILNLLFIRVFKQNGAAIASVLTEFMVSFSMIYLCNRIIKLRYNIREYILPILSSVFMAIAIYIIKSLLKDFSNITLLIFQVLVGSLVYGISLILLKSETMNELLLKVKKR